MIHVKSIKVVIVCIFLYSITPLNADIPWLHVDGNKIKDPYGNIVILRGISLIDLGFLEGWQGGAINMIDRLTDRNDSQGSSPGWYPKVIRIPIHPPDSVNNWPHRWDPDDDSFYNNLLRPVVDYCADKDLYVIIDWHYVTNTWDKVAQTSEFWEYMAPRFANDSHVLFELFNEPINDVNGDWIGNTTNDWLSVRNDMQTWINIVRSYAPRNLILVAGAFYSQIIGPAATYPVSDPVGGNNIAYVSHIYPGHWLDNNWSWWYVNQITTCAAVYPVIMTEWGFTSDSNYDDQYHLLIGTITNYGQPLMDFIEGLGIGNTAWTASYDWGPPMFRRDWTLRCGEGEMGCFVKDTLYLRRNDDQPGRPVQAPVGVGALEDFETNDFSKFPWEHSGDNNWTTTSYQKHSGTYSALTGTIADDESTTLHVTLDCVSGDITFYRKVSSESGFDYLKFYIDGPEKGSWSGEEDWAEVSFPVSAGTRTFTWTYSKDSSDYAGNDAAWIDDIVFPVYCGTVVDDFEQYNDSGRASYLIFDKWIDGRDEPTNGSQVGHATRPYAERTIVLGGAQSMPYYYENNFKYSEATITLTSPRDWTENDVGVLSLWFHGDLSNAPEPMYVSIADSTGTPAVVYHDNPDAAQIEAWTQWNIDLKKFADQSVDLTNVDKLSIGFGDKNNLQEGGSGLVYFDDIRLYNASCL